MRVLIPILGLCTLSGGILPMTPHAEASAIVRYDMTALDSLNLNTAANRRAYFDQSHLAASLQGLVNRATPQLYLRYNRVQDDFWWARMTESGAWLDGAVTETSPSLDDLLDRFAGAYRGAVIWDERVPATSNLASTLAGVEDLLPFRYDESPGSLYQRFIANGPRIPVLVRLMNDDGSPMFTGTGTIPGTTLPSTGSAKNDAYRWLIEHYVKTGRCNPLKMGYYLDGYWLQAWQAATRTNSTLTNHDYVIAHRGVLFDLNVWEDEATVDDPGQAPGTDVATLKALLHAAYAQFGGDGFIHIAGFVPWAYKYTTHGNAGGAHEPVPTEWRYAEIISCFNGYMDADAIGLASMANASFFQHAPLPEVIPQNPKPTEDSLKAAGILDERGHIIPRRYYAHYVGDYDAAAWIYQQMPQIWTDANRGQTPLTWAFNPNLAERFAFGMLWTRQTRTANDYFSAGDSGAGYINPGNLVTPRPFSDLPSGVAAWEAHCLRYYQQWDITLTGFVIDGYARGLTEELLDSYARFSPGGIVPQKIPPQGVHNGMPWIRMNLDLPHDAGPAAAALVGQFSGRAPQFRVFRSILKTPSWYLNVDTAVQNQSPEPIRAVDLYTLLWLVREYITHPERYSEYGGATMVRARPGAEEGLYTVCLPDGPCQQSVRAGVDCFLTPKNTPPHYLYFDVDDFFFRASGLPVTIELTWYDEGQGEFLLQYDSTDPSGALDGAYTNAGSVRRGNTRTWRTHTWTLDNARFEGRQNGAADFRIYSSGDDLHVREVLVRKILPDPNLHAR